MKPKIVNAKKPRSANRRKPRSRPARCSAAHVHFEITTREGNRAMIKGDPSMPETTMRAIASMIDALAQAIVRRREMSALAKVRWAKTVRKPKRAARLPNDRTERPPTQNL